MLFVVCGKNSPGKYHYTRNELTQFPGVSNHVIDIGIKDPTGKKLAHSLKEKNYTGNNLKIIK